jgi:hypothetical protein
VHAAALLIVGAALAAAVGTASASRLEVRGAERGFRFTWSAFSVLTAFNETGYFTSCPVTMEGSFNARTIAKVPGIPIGYVTRAVVTEASCRGGANVRIHFLQETLPWQLRYSAFTGVLPRIGRVRATLNNVAIRVSELGWNCLFRATSEKSMLLALRLGLEGAPEETVTAVTAAAEILTPLLPRFSGDFGCYPEMNYAGEGSVTALGSTTRLSITLI